MRAILRLFVVLSSLTRLSSAQTTTETFGSGANQFSITFVSVGSPNNLSDGSGSPSGAGSVSYSYKIGKFEVSRDLIEKANAQGGLSITLENMATYGFSNNVNMPATSISWKEAARFVNFLNTNQGKSPAYKIDGNGNLQPWIVSDNGYNPSNPFRNNLAKFWLPTSSEWYKAAYFGTNGLYYSYPNGGNNVPSRVSNGTNGAVWWTNGPSSVTNAGSLSPWGTMAQGGNAQELIESAFDGTNNDINEDREVRGGSWVSGDPTSLSRTFRFYINPAEEGYDVGFRIASGDLIQLALNSDSKKGSVTVSPTGPFVLNSTINLTANPNPGYLFSSWSGAQSNSNQSISLLLDSDKTINANFTEDTRDTDNDGLSNYQEIINFNTNPNIAETSSPVPGLFLAADLSIKKTEGKNQVIANPNAFNLYTITQYNDNLATGFNAGRETGKAEGRAEVTSFPFSYSLYTATQYIANYLAGQQSVLFSPNIYNLYTAQQYANNFTAGKDSVLNSPNSNGLYTTNQIQDMSMGGLVLSKSGNVFTLNYSIEKSNDLGAWTQYQSFTLPLSGLSPDKAFVRLKMANSSSGSSSQAADQAAAQAALAAAQAALEAARAEQAQKEAILREAIIRDANEKLAAAQANLAVAQASGDLAAQAAAQANLATAQANLATAQASAQGIPSLY
jgi:hypothetical protein